MNDKSIISLFEQRDERGIREAERAYGGLLKRLALRILGDERDAEECLSDTMLRAWNAIPPEKPRFFRAYLAKLTRNLALNRSDANRAQMRGGNSVPLALDELAECIPDGNNPEQVIDKIALTAALEEFLGQLSDQHAKIFMLRYFSMLDIGEIAAELQIPVNTVKSVLCRTRAKLQVYLTKEELL